MARYIDADALLKYIKTNAPYIYTMVAIMSGVIPTADVVEVKHAEWVDKFNNKYDNQVYVCSECGEKAYLQLAVDELGNVIRRQALTPFCPTCGADMRGDDK